MKIIGLTGGMASGKSTVAQHWESLGAYVMYADAVAKSLMTEDPALVQQLKATFGEEKAAGGYPVFVKEAALLLKNGRPEGFDAIVMVDAPEAQRIRRVARRDALPEAEVKSRMRNQQSAEALRELSDIIIENTGSRSELLEKAETIYQQLLQA
jgi:dephospho-CoA kinase